MHRFRLVLPAVRRSVLVWIALMSGVFSLGKDLLFSYLADAGHPVSPHGALYVFGRLSWAAFVISALVAWWFEHRQVTQLQTRLNSLTDEKTRRRAIYDHLSRFLIAADKIKRVCSNPEHVIPTESAEKWEIEVARYIRTNLGESESNRFIYETNVPPAPETPFEPVRANLLKKMHCRSFQLSKLLDEVRPQLTPL